MKNSTVSIATFTDYRDIQLCESKSGYLEYLEKDALTKLGYEYAKSNAQVRISWVVKSSKDSSEAYFDTEEFAKQYIKVYPEYVITGKRTVYSLGELK